MRAEQRDPAGSAAHDFRRSCCCRPAVRRCSPSRTHQRASACNANGDFRLSLGSIGVDFAPAAAQTVTRDGGVRVFDIVPTMDRFGPQDLGAYEYAPPLIFADGFESGGT